MGSASPTKAFGVAASIESEAATHKLLLSTADLRAWTSLIEELKAFGFIVESRLAAGERSTLQLHREPQDTAGRERTPIVVLATQHSLKDWKAAIDSGAVAYFSAPIDVLTLCSVLFGAVTLDRADDQTISVVVGILMERYRLQRTDAYERLRSYARRERRKLVSVADEVIQNSEHLGKMLKSIGAHAP